jgi:ectoine hydroxylase-related dioxygenase (phytanoyl-CoA dioxygenase family)
MKRKLQLTTVTETEENTNNKKQKQNIFTKGFEKIFKYGIGGINKHYLHENGFTVLNINGPVDILDPVQVNSCITTIKDYAKSHDSYIFNNKKNDNKRRQCNLNSLITKDLEVKKLTTQVELTVRNYLIDSKSKNKFKVSSWVALRSLPNCKEQLPHTDYVPTETFKQATNSNNNTNMPLLCLVALEDDTKLNVWRKSHKLITKDDIKLKKVKRINKTILKLKAGEMLVFRGDLIHAGAAYDKENVRLHCFFDNINIKRDPNRTYIISKHASKVLQEKII